MEFIGRTIKEIRFLTKEELQKEGWYPDEIVSCIVLDNGAVIYPSKDYKGNGPGALFINHNSKNLTLSHDTTS